MTGVPELERMESHVQIQTVVIGGGQAGLSVGYHLARRGLPFVILDASERIGDAWRKRWDSLRLFTPARFDGLDGMPFPASAYSFPTKDEMADYLEAYATRFRLPVRTGVRVDCLTRQGDRFLVRAGRLLFEADNVVVAMSSYQEHRVPSFARELAPEIVQLHSGQYRGPAQLKAGGVLVVGAGNSGAEIAVEVARTHRTWLSGRATGEIPFNTTTSQALPIVVPLVFRGLFHRVLTVDTPMGRKARPSFLTRGAPLIRVKSRELSALGVRRVGRTLGVRDELPLLDDGRVLDVTNVIWCTGFSPAHSWIELPIFGGTPSKEPIHERGIVAGEPGLYFVGLTFLYAASSSMLHGVGRDAEHIVKHLSARTRKDRAGATRRPVPVASSGNGTPDMDRAVLGSPVRPSDRQSA
jgi:putative flavoprotein involved in K+ transport